MSSSKAHANDSNTTRIAVLEQIAQNTHETLIEIKTELKNLRLEMKQEFSSIRNEIQGFRSEVNNRFVSMQDQINSQFKWVIGTVLFTFAIPILLKMFKVF